MSRCQTIPGPGRVHRSPDPRRWPRHEFSRGFAEARNEFEFVRRKETEFDYISKKGEFWGCSRAVTRSRAESEVASLGGFVRCLRNLQRPLLCPGWERPQNERRATGSDSEVAPLGWRKKRKGAGRKRNKRQAEDASGVGGVVWPAPVPTRRSWN